MWLIMCPISYFLSYAHKGHDFHFAFTSMEDIRLCSGMDKISLNVGTKKLLIRRESWYLCMED